MAGIRLEGSVEEDRVGEEHGFLLNRVDEDYFSVLGVNLVEGRFFRPDDFSRGGADPVAIVSDALAAWYWPGESAVGNRFTFPGSEQPLIRVVGVVEGFRNVRLRDVQHTVFAPLDLTGGLR